MIKENQRTLNQINGLTDVLTLFPSMVLAYILRFYVFQGQPGHIGLSYYLWAVVILAPFVWLLYGLMGLYESFRSKNFLTEFSLLLRSNTILFLLILAFFFIYKEFHLSRWTLLAFFLIATCGITLKRWLLRRLLPQRLVDALLPPETAGRKIAELSRAARQQICDRIHDFRTVPAGLAGLKKAEACRGGMDTRQVDPYSLQSTVRENLWIVGELLDVTGLLGGYNLHWAWASGMAAGRALALFAGK